jgi:hypothetical protein
VDFRPTFFVSIDDHIGRKLDVLRTFASQSAITDYLDPDVIVATARYWSRFTDGRHAEAFEGIRDRAAARVRESPGAATAVPSGQDSGQLEGHS